MPIRDLFNRKNILPTILAIVSLVIFVPINSDALTFLVHGILSEILAGIAAAIWIFRMPKTKVRQISNYLIVGFPSVLALGILVVFYSFGFNTQQPLFVADMWFVVLATIGAILTMFFSEKKVNSLETRINGFEIRIDNFEHELNDMNIKNEREISEQNAKIEILNEIAWTRFELEKAKAELYKQQSKKLRRLN